MLRSSFILSVMLFVAAYGLRVEIDPVDPILRLGQTARMLCKAESSVRGCLWYINSQLYNPEPNPEHDIRAFGSREDGECGIEFASISPSENGQWACHMFLVADPSKSESAITNVTTLVLPTITMETVNNNKVSVVAGELTELTCTVANARPQPAVLWKIGDREITERTNENYRTTSVSGDNLVTIVDTLRYPFAPSDHAQTVRCLTAGSWIDVGQDEYQTSAELDVMFAPQPQEPITLYGFVDGQQGDIVVNFTANPGPTKVTWILENHERLEVPATGVSYDNADFEVYAINGSQGTYEARLRLKLVTEESAQRLYRLSVESNFLGQDHSAEYTVHISMNEAPLPCKSTNDCSSEQVSTLDSDSLAAELGAGQIAAIILVMVALLVIVAVIMYARNTGRFCFAGTKAVGVSTKERSDEEAANVELDEGDDVKVETNARQSLTNRLSSLYETILSKAAPNKKSERFTGVGSAAADSDVKDGAIVYAELDLKSSDESSCLRGKEETTEYAEIVPVATEETKSSDQDQNQTQSTST